MIIQEVYKRIRQRREELGLSQDELAKKLGYKSRSSINKIEKLIKTQTGLSLTVIKPTLKTKITPDIEIKIPHTELAKEGKTLAQIEDFELQFHFVGFFDFLLFELCFRLLPLKLVLEFFQLC